jgi:hypothetical protein
MATGIDFHIGDSRSTAKIFTKVFENGQQRIAVVCSRCQSQDTQGASMGVPASRAAKNFRTRGWRIDRKCHEAVCPRCQEEESSMKQSPEAIRAQAKLYSLLEEHFDPEKKRYRLDWTDDKVSKACSLSVDQVSATREALYGPMVDPAVAKAEAEIDRIQAQLTELESFVKTETAKLRTELAKARGALQGTRG